MSKIGDMLGGNSGRAEVEAARQLKEGNYLTAGKLLEEAGQLSRAVEVYLKGNEFAAAAEVCLRQGRNETAAELFLKGADHRRAADAYAKAGQAARGAEIFLERGNSLEAARYWGLANAWDKAGDLYQRAGYPLRAAQAFEKAGDLARAAECYERHFVENVSYATGGGSSSADQKTAAAAGRLFEKVGAFDRALEIYSRGGYHREAAVVATRLAQHAKAADLFTRAEDLTSAAEAWRKAGDPVKAALLEGEVAFKEDRMADAAALFRQGQDFYRAAELFESLGMLSEAAGAYEGGGSFAEAGSVYVRAGRKDRAAAAFEMAGQFEVAARLLEELGEGVRAAALFEKAGLTFKSAESAVRAGDRQRAIALLQRVPPEDEHCQAAAELLGRLFVEVGMPNLAVERLRQALEGQTLRPDNLGLWATLGAALEALGETNGALTLYQKILAVDYSFGDVTQRIERLRAGGDRALEVVEFVEETAPPPAPPATAAPAQVALTASSIAGPRFVTQDEVGRGPLGVVYRAEDQTDGRNVALRVLPEAAFKPDLLGALVGDLVAAARLSHPNLVKVLGVVDLDAQSCVLSEFVRGSNLAESLRAGQRMSVQQCHNLGRALAQVLQFVHARGMVHGSIQPSNVMVVSGVVKLADLGLGRLYRAATPANGYRAPENRLDVAGDIYALGALLYHVVTGVEPKRGGPVHRPGQLAPGVPDRFDRFIMRCLDPRPDARFSAADEVLQALEAMVTIS
jgi:eukaryotic-like serine/threonine-protein kinase